LRTTALDGGAGAWNLGSGSTDIVCEKGELYKYYNVFQFNGPNCSGAKAKHFRCLELEPKILVPAPLPCSELNYTLQ